MWYGVGTFRCGMVWVHLGSVHRCGMVWVHLGGVPRCGMVWVHYK